MQIISGTYKNRKIKVPTGFDVRPTTNQVREAVFNICQTIIKGAKFLDLFAGSGALGLEALSRGAHHVTFVEANKKHCKCIRENANTLKVLDQTTLLCGDVLKKIPQFKEEFDIIYADPPYHQIDLYHETIHLIDKTPLLSKEGIVIMEGEERFEFKKLKQLVLSNVKEYGRIKLFLFTH